MGITNTIYIGPYIKIVPKTVETQIEKRGCTNLTCVARYNDLTPQQYNDCEFCPKCGKPIENYTTSKPEDLYLHNDFLDPFGESLCYANDYAEGITNILIPNQHGFGITINDDDNANEVIFDADHMVTSHNKFITEYEEELEDLKNYVVSFEIKWGVLNYAY